MSKWIAEFELEDGDTMPEHMDLEYKGAIIDFHCRPMWIPVGEKLPEQAGWYLISFGDKWAGDGLGAVSGKRKFYDSDVRISSWDGTKFYHGMVAAWMPLPEGYHG